MAHDVQPAVARKSPPPAAWRWAVLVAVSIAMFGNYYAFDSVGPVADLLQRQLGYTDTQLGWLNAIYSFPNIIMVLVGGIIVDRFGAARATLAFAVIQAIGAIVTALSPSFPVMAAGRLIFGLGAESMIVAVTVAIGQWFVGRQLGFAFGLNLSFARLGSYSADMSTNWFKPLYDRGWQPPLWLAAGFAVVCVVGAAAYYVLDRRARGRFDLRGAQTDRFVWSDLWRFDRSYWYILGLCVTFYSVIFPFRSTFAIKYFQHAHDLSLQEAGAMNAYVFLAAIFATPTFGLIADRIGLRAALMAFGTALLAAVFPLLAYTNVNLWIVTVMIGVAFSLVPAVLWPAVPMVVTGNRLGTAYGLMTMLQNIGMMLANLGAGALNDANGAGPDSPAGYVPMLWMFFVLSLFGFRRRAGHPSFHHFEQHDGLRLVHFEERSAVDVHADEHHARIVPGSMTRVAFLGEPCFPVRSVELVNLLPLPRDGGDSRDGDPLARPVLVVGEVHVRIAREIVQLRRVLQRDEPQVRAFRTLLGSHRARMQMPVGPSRRHHGDCDVVDVAVQLLELVLHPSLRH